MDLPQELVEAMSFPSHLELVKDLERLLVVNPPSLDSLSGEERLKVVAIGEPLKNLTTKLQQNHNVQGNLHGNID